MIVLWDVRSGVGRPTLVFVEFVETADVDDGIFDTTTLVKCFDIWFGNHRGVIFTRDVSRAGFAVLIYASMSMFLR